jgi:site-specific DNA-methyltransferase (adenine-specific)
VKNFTAEIKHGDCLNVLADFPDDTFDLIVTSPPYADRRKHTYGGVPPEKYVEWFLPRSEQFLRVLKPTGTFILNIRSGPHCLDHETQKLS